LAPIVVLAVGLKWDHECKRFQPDSKSFQRRQAAEVSGLQWKERWLQRGGMELNRGVAGG
jgi:hypothetical protein